MDNWIILIRRKSDEKLQAIVNVDGSVKEFPEQEDAEDFMANYHMVFMDWQVFQIDL